MAYSLVSIVSTDHHAAINALGAAIGWGDNEHAVPLSASGFGPVTHYGLRTWASAATKSAFEALKNPAESIPTVKGFTKAQIKAAIQACEQTWRDDAPGIGAQHWADALTTVGLARVIEPDHTE